MEKNHTDELQTQNTEKNVLTNEAVVRNSEELQTYVIKIENSIQNDSERFIQKEEEQLVSGLKSLNEKDETVATKGKALIGQFGDTIKNIATTYQQKIKTLFNTSVPAVESKKFHSGISFAEFVAGVESGLYKTEDMTTDPAKANLETEDSDPKPKNMTIDEQIEYEKKQIEKDKELLRKFKRRHGSIERLEQEISPEMIKEAQEKRLQLLEGRGLFQMSKEDFKKYFGSKEIAGTTNLMQAPTVGDCYLVAALDALSGSPHFETIVRSSMKRLSDGSWEVQVPLLSEEGKTIKIEPKEIKSQFNKKFMKSIDAKGLRPILGSLSGKEGMKVLEAAFIKDKFGSVDRLAAEGGYGGDVLIALGGENFLKYSVGTSRPNKKGTKSDRISLNSLGPKDMADLDAYLEGYDPETHIATATTKTTTDSLLSPIMKKTLGMYPAKNSLKFFAFNHAYSISDVDKKNKMITMANPWYTGIPIKLSFDEFKEEFGQISAVRINNAKLLQNMERVKEKAEQVQ